MPSTSHLLVCSLLTTAVVNCQQYDPSPQSLDAFTYVQPRNTTILGPYGHSPPILPSRKYLINV